MAVDPVRASSRRASGRGCFDAAARGSLQMNIVQAMDEVS